MPLSMPTSMEAITGIEMERVMLVAYHIHFSRQTSIPFKDEINFAKFRDIFVINVGRPGSSCGPQLTRHTCRLHFYIFCSAFDTLIREGEHVRGRVALFATCHHVVVDAARKFLHLCRPKAEGQAVWKKSTLNW